MNRIGCVFLAIVAIVGGLFLSFTRFGHPRFRSASTEGTATGGGYPTLAVPVEGVARASITDSWLDPRSGGTRQHHGTDIMAPGGTPVLATAPGTIEKLFESKLGGTTLYERSPDGHWQYYYAHLAGYAAGVHEGEAVRTGDPIGFVGNSGDAEGGPTHLHFGLSRMSAGDGWWQGTPINPYPLLAGRGGGG